MMFTEENPLKSPRRPSLTALSDPLHPDATSPFSAYLEDTYKIKPTNDTATGRNSFCSQGSTATESSSSTFSSATYLSNYLQSFRSNSPNNRAASTTDAHENCKNVKMQLEQTENNNNSSSSSSSSDRNNNIAKFNSKDSLVSCDRTLIDNTNSNTTEPAVVSTLSDYNFVDTGLIAYLPEKLALLLKEAIYLFNLKPSSAKEFLISKKVITNSPSEFADFIYTNSSNQSKLSKRRIGEFVGNSSTYNQEVLYYFLAKFDFTNMALDEAIRSLVRQFRLPGEAQQIDRILEKFANVYYSQNVEPIYKSGSTSNAIKSADVAYILSFSILMLNTDLHNPSVPLKNKMTLNEFIRNNRGINNGLDLAPEHLESLYTRIKQDEIKMEMSDMLESDVPAFMAPIMAGYLLKLYHVAMVPMWKKRWFILNDGCLYYFYKPYETKPKCIMPLENIRIEVPSHGVNVAAVMNDANHNFVSRNSSSTNIYDTSNGGNRRKAEKGKVSFTEHDSSLNNDCILILYGAASNGLLKSGKLSKTGAMTLAPRSRLVLRAGSAAERDEWLTALQADNQNFDPLRGTINLRNTGKKDGKLNIPQGTHIVGGDKVEVEKGIGPNQVSRYDTEIYNTDSTDLALLGSLNFTRRGSASSTNSEYIDNEGSINSARSFVSWNSDQSVASGEISPDGRHRSDGPNGQKWAMPFAVNFNRQKNVSFPNGSPGDPASSLSKAIDISAMPDATIFGNRNNASRKVSSSSIQSFASGRSSGQGTYSTYSDDTMFGISEILLEGYIWRYTLEAKLNAADATGLTPRPRGLTPESLPPVDREILLRLNSDSTDSNNSTHDVRVVSSAARAIRSNNTSSPDLSRIEHVSSSGSLDSIRSSEVTVHVKTPGATRQTRSESLNSNVTAVRRRSLTVNNINSAPSSEKVSLIPLPSPPVGDRSLIQRIESGEDQNSTRRTFESSLLEVAIPASDYLNNNFDEYHEYKSSSQMDMVTATSDLTGDSSFSGDFDRISDIFHYESVVDQSTGEAAISNEIDKRKSPMNQHSPTIITPRDLSHLDITSIIDEIPAVSTSAASTLNKLSPKSPKSSKSSPRRSSKMTSEAPIMNPSPGAASITSGNTRNLRGSYQDSKYQDSEDIVVKSLSNRKLRSPSASSSNVYSNQSGSKAGSPSFVSPKKLSSYLTEINTPNGGINTTLPSCNKALLERDYKDSPSKTNINVPPLSFAGLKNNMKNADTTCPVGVNISSGTLGTGLGSIPKGNGKSLNSVVGVRDARKWKKMYVTLYSDTDGKGDILFYFPNEEAALCTRNSGVQTQQGYLRMRCVQSVAISNDERISSINIFTKNELLSFALVSPSEDIYRWVDTLRQSAENAQDT